MSHSDGPSHGPNDDSPDAAPSHQVSQQIEPGLARYVALALVDLVERLQVETSEITVLSAQPRVWPNSALGCPRPGMQYLQVPVDGSLITLQVGKIIYRYHAGGSKNPFLCR